MAEEKQPVAEEKPSLMASSLPSFNIWPPNQKTRDAVIRRLVETLSSPSVLSKRYGVMDTEEAASTARVIEEKAFLAASDMPPAEASDTAADDPVARGIETLQVYSKEISRLVLDAVKSRASSSENPQSSPLADDVAAPSEDPSQPSPVFSESSEN
ncbi:MFP1 attachment factor 1 [Nymphaea thermarum]|nr:MFP1 attachment factor 1 [Nymphaea thermarum]